MISFEDYKSTPKAVINAMEHKERIARTRIKRSVERAYQSNLQAIDDYIDGYSDRLLNKVKGETE